MAEPVQIPADEKDGRKKFIDNKENSTYSVLENRKPALTDEEQAVLARLSQIPQEASALMDALDMPSGKVLSVLTMLTVKGYAQKHPGGSFSVK